MTFADLAAGDAFFIDANIFVYHFGSGPIAGLACSQIIQRVENQEIQGFTSKA
jgi:predicted nucleic acid-binding protein